MHKRHTYLVPHESILRVLEAKTSHDTYKVIVDQAIVLSGATCGSIFLYTNRQFQRVYASTPSLFTLNPRPKGNTYHVYSTGTFYLKYVTEFTRAHPELQSMNLGMDLCVALTYERKSIAVLSIFSSKGKKFTMQTVKRVKEFCAFGAFILKKNQQIEAMKQALDSRNLLISMTAHEVKTPLAALIGYTQLLRRKVNTQSGQGFIKKLLHQEQRVQHLIDDFSSKKSVEDSMRSRTYAVQINQIVEHAKSEVQNSFPHHRFQLIDSKESYIVKGDSLKLQQAISNILVNAAKYSSVDYPIKIMLSREKRYCLIQVSDHGSGIPKNKISFVFNKYYRLSERTEGMGLGLYIVKQIIEAHKGGIFISSTVGKGTDVTIKLPLLIS